MVMVSLFQFFSVNNTLIQNIATLIPFLPLMGFILLFALGKKLSHSLSGILASGLMVASFFLSALLFFQISQNQSVEIHLMHWLRLDTWDVSFSWSIDALSGIMMLVITGIGALIHIFSVAYMHDDKDINRYFSYLNLFVFFMLVLVMADNFVLMFAGWEGVGLCSYLLIGFWYDHQAYNDAANKAFIINRVGDLAFLLGMFLLFQQLGTLNFREISNLVSGSADSASINPSPLAPGILFAATLLLFLGATGKSAQIPLFTWLPDAMAGPTPVSALIHAATMVTAGIYLILRNHLLFSMSPATMDIITMTGLATSLLAGLIALKQNDIKKILAYSTVSQLGLIFFALGIGAFHAAFFHLLTHAFFKALLFLSAGSIIHALHGEQDIRRMGGLKNKLKVTHFVFGIALLAIIALPPFSGFFSKDAILVAAFDKSPVLWMFGLLSGLITAWYMLRLYFVAFSGEPRWRSDLSLDVHDAPPAMSVPLLVLAIFSFFGGLLNVPSLFHGNEWLGHTLESIIPFRQLSLQHSTEWILMAISTSLILLVLWLTFHKFHQHQILPSSDEGLPDILIQKWIRNKFYVDEAYEKIVVKPLFRISKVFYSVLDRKVIHNVVESSGNLSLYLGRKWKETQNGYISYYLFALALGMAGILIIFILL